MGFQTRIAPPQKKKKNSCLKCSDWKNAEKKHAMPKNAWRCCFSPKVFKATSHCAARARTDKTWCPLGKLANHASVMLVLWVRLLKETLEMMDSPGFSKKI